MNQPAPAPAEAPLSAAFAALRHRNYRLLWVGQLISTAGSMMQNAAVLWHVSLLAPEHKALALSMVGLCKFVPIVVLSLMSGVIADAHDRRRLLIIANIVWTVLACALALITFTGWASLWMIYVLTALASAVGAFDVPARQSFIPQLVPSADLPSAITLNTVLFQAASVGGPALAGFTIAGFGVAGVYFANALSFLAVVAALFMMRDIPPRASGPRSEVSVKAALEGLRYVWNAPLIRSSMLLDFFATFFSSATALLPIYAQDILQVGEKGYGLLYAAPAIGALLASAVLAPFASRIVRRGAWLLWSVVVYGIATVLFGTSQVFWLTYLCLALTGAADTISMVLRNIIRQLATPDHLRGRMMSVNMIFFMGGPQLGEFEAGLVAQSFGPVASVVSGGLGCLVATGWIAWSNPLLRRYRREPLDRTSGSKT